MTRLLTACMSCGPSKHDQMEVLTTGYGIENANNYILKETLGAGTFGEVKKAINRRNGQEVAIKFVRILSKKDGVPRAVFRELESLRQLHSCPYITKLQDIYANESNLCIVLEYVASDLSLVIERTDNYLSLDVRKSLYKMMFGALAFCHSRRVIHRDIKPANLLLSSSGILKLGDFGLARIFDSNSTASMSHQVSTRQYRAPELLYASRHYTCAIDVWGIAVVMVELISLQPLFPSNNDIDQMYRVFQLMGSPTPDRWKDVERLPDYHKVCFPNMDPLDIRLIIPHAPESEITFVTQSLQLDPAQRLSAVDAFNHQYFVEHPVPAPPSTIPIPMRDGKKKPNPVLPLSGEQYLSQIVQKTFQLNVK